MLRCHRLPILGFVSLSLLLLMLAGSQTACKGGKKNQKADTSLTDDDDDDGPTFSGMPVENAKIVGDSIILDVEYTGSYPRIDDFTLTWDGKSLVGAQPYVRLELYDKSMSVNSSMAFKSQLKYSLKTLGVPKPCTIFVGGKTVNYK